MGWSEDERTRVGGQPPGRVVAVGGPLDAGSVPGGAERALVVVGAGLFVVAGPSG